MLHGDLLGERARLTPQRVALVLAESGRSFTYEGLNRRARDWAGMMRRRLGLNQGDRCAILSANRLEFLDALFGAAKSGVVLVPLNTRLTAAEIEVILRDCGARGLIYSAGNADAIRVLAGRVELDHWVALDEPVAGGHISYNECLRDVDQIEQRCMPEDLLCILYTSGTTGTPKGVMIPHRMVAWNACNTALCWGLGGDDVSPVFTPLYHAGGLAAFLMPIICAGGKIVLHERFDAGEVLAAIERESCTVALFVPTILKLLLDHPRFAETDFSSVKWFISGGAPLPVYLIEEYRRRAVVVRQGYGLTEVGVNCFSMTNDEAWLKPGTIGKPLMFTEARLVDPAGRDVALGENGELLLRGPHVSLGYWRNPEATAAAIDSDGFFHTEDLAKRDDDSFYTIVGRIKDMFISGGINVYPAEIEAAILLHPTVQDAAVIGVPDSSWGEVGVAFVVWRAGEDIAALDAFLRERLAAYKIPKRFITKDELPRTAYGKVVKAALVDEYHRSCQDSADSSAAL